MASSRFVTALRRVRKAIVAVVVPVVVLLALNMGLDIDNETAEVITTAIVTGVMVYFVPNAADGLRDENGEDE